MKKLLKSKKVLITGLLIAAIAISGLTYAWFTSRSDFSASSNMSRLDINVTGDDEFDYHYAPGNSVSLSYTIDNVHEGAREGLYMDGLVQADFAHGSVDIWSDENGRPITPVTYPINKDHLDLTVDVKSVIDEETNQLSIWFIDRTTGIYYNQIDPGMSSAATVEIHFKGKEMGNVYQGSVFHFNNGFLATQINEEAIMDVHGLDLSNLDMIDFIDTDGNVLSANTRAKTIDSTGKDYTYYKNMLLDRLGK